MSAAFHAEDVDTPAHQGTENAGRSAKESSLREKYRAGVAGVEHLLRPRHQQSSVQYHPNGLARGDMPDSQPWIVRQHSPGADEHCIITAAQNMRHAAGRFGRDPSRSAANIGDESIERLRPFQSHERHTRAMKMEEALVDLFCLLAKHADPHMNAGVP